MKVRIGPLLKTSGEATNYTDYWLWCPGCDQAHRITSSWTFDGDVEQPTFSPSILVRYNREGTDHVCHSFVTAGVWKFLPDSTHDKAGQDVPMVDLPEWLEKENG